MNLKQRVKYAVCEIGHIPFVAKIAAFPKVQRVVAKLPGLRVIYDTGWARLHPFDRFYGLETSLTKDAEDQQLADHPSASYAHSYAGSQPGPLRAVLKLLSDLKNSTFIDLGCGKGRPLFVATEFPFRDVIGVELSPGLAEVARRNAAKMAKRYPSRTRVRVEIGDAGNYTFPSGDIVLYLYNPFAEPVIRKVVAGIDSALSAEKRSVYVIFCNPTLGHCFDGSLNLTRLFARTLRLDATEQNFGPSPEEHISLWRGGTASDTKEPPV